MGIVYRLFWDCFRMSPILENLDYLEIVLRMRIVFECGLCEILFWKWGLFSRLFRDCFTMSPILDNGDYWDGSNTKYWDTELWNAHVSSFLLLLTSSNLSVGQCIYFFMIILSTQLMLCTRNRKKKKSKTPNSMLI